jgi:hypothetical protein
MLVPVAMEILLNLNLQVPNLIRSFTGFGFAKAPAIQIIICKHITQVGMIIMLIL